MVYYTILGRKKGENIWARWEIRWTTEGAERALKELQAKYPENEFKLSITY